MIQSLRRLPLIFASLLLVACADQVTDSADDLRPHAATLDIVSGQDQVGLPGAQLPSPLVVRVLDKNGKAVAGQIVNFQVTAGGGTPYAGTALTNSSGVAQEWWVLGPSPGTNTVEARAVDSSTGQKRVFATFQAEAQAPVDKVLVSPSTGSIPAGGTLQLSATVTDASGTILTNRGVSWSSSNTAVATVSSTGANTSTVTGVAAGTVTITATSEGVSGTTTATVTQTDLLAGHDFNNGGLGPYVYPWAGLYDADMEVVDDPTGSGKGKVLRLHYAGTAQDRNRAIEWSPTTGIGFGQTLHFRGEFNLGTLSGGENDQRKLLYWQKNPSATSNFFSVVALWSNTMKFEGGAVGYTVTRNNIVTGLQQNRWYTLEKQITINSAPELADGILRLWLDGALVYENHSMRWIAVSGPAEKFQKFQVGNQTQSAESFDEYRYWDNVKFAGQRITSP